MKKKEAATEIKIGGLDWLYARTSPPDGPGSAVMPEVDVWRG